LSIKWKNKFEQKKSKFESTFSKVQINRNWYSRLKTKDSKVKCSPKSEKQIGIPVLTLAETVSNDDIHDTSSVGSRSPGRQYLSDLKRSNPVREQVPEWVCEWLRVTLTWINSILKFIFKSNCKFWLERLAQLWLGRTGGQRTTGSASHPCERLDLTPLAIVCDYICGKLIVNRSHKY
jgi:hypothetical protein